MISSVRGIVLSAAGSTAVVEVGGVGLAVTVTPQHALSLRVGSEASIRTALIVREDDLALFGFAEADQLVVFDLLRGVTGVGPKSAMGVLSTMTPDQIAAAVTSEDDAAFRKVSGIGPKTAKLIVVSLAGKLLAPVRPTASTVGMSSVRDNVTVALIGLGWTEKVAAQAAQDALDGAPAAERDQVPVLLRLALASLGPSHHSAAVAGVPTS
jgi:Holliday junction DNA helicase RuvA